MPGTMTELSVHDCLATPSASGRTVWRLQGPEGIVEVHVSGRFYANSAQVLLKATLAGLGIALLPDVMTSPHVHAGQLTEVLPDLGGTGLDVYLVYLSRRQLPRAVSAFIDFAMTRMVAEGLVRPPTFERPRAQRTA